MSVFNYSNLIFQHQKEVTILEVNFCYGLG